MHPRNVKRPSALMLMLLAASLTGCGTTSPVYVTSSPQLPEMPQLSEPLPSELYSSSARRDIKCWRDVATGTSPTCGP